MTSEKALYLVTKGRARLYESDTVFNPGVAVLVYALDEADALRLADLYDRSLVGVGKITVTGTTYAAVIDGHPAYKPGQYYKHKHSDRMLSGAIAARDGIDLTDYVELVTCRDGVLRPIDSVSVEDREQWPTGEIDPLRD